MTDDALAAAIAFLRKRLVSTPPNVDMEDVWFASLLDEAEAVGRAALATPAPTEDATLDSAYRMALGQIEHDGEVINRLKQALRVATHSPHDQSCEPNEGFPTCSECGAIQTDPTEDATLDVERVCGARAVGGPCRLPRGHNMGQADIPANHEAAPPSWGFIDPDTGDFIGVTDEGMRERWSAPITESALAEALRSAYEGNLGDMDSDSWETMASRIVANLR